jgi:hypothetical protein
VKDFSKKAFRALAPLMLIMVLGAVPTFAAGISPVGTFLEGVRTEATSIWAVAGTVVGLVIGLLGMLFGEHHAKEWGARAAIVSVCLLSVEALVAWL